MKKKKNSFLTFVFSLLPGAGHMYMGFMKMGVSLMAAFFFTVFLSSWLNLGPLLFILPVLWFYSFFDCINRRYSTDDAFALLDDRYLFSLDRLTSINTGFLRKRSLFAGIVLVLLGTYILWNNLLNHFNQFIPQKVYSVLMEASRMAPQLFVGVLIVVIGVRLIVNKKRAGDDNV